MKVAIIGQGYVGLSLAMRASGFHEVIGYDLDESKIRNLKLGVSYIEGIENDEIAQKLNSRNYFPTSDESDIVTR